MAPRARRASARHLPPVESGVSKEVWANAHARDHISDKRGQQDFVADQGEVRGERLFNNREL